MTKGTLDHPTLGRVIVTINPRARRFTARWRSGEVYLTSPPVEDIAKIRSILDRMAPSLLDRRPVLPILAPGHTIPFTGFSLTVEGIDRPGLIGSRIDADNMILRLSHDVDPAEPGAHKLIARHIRRMAEFMAPRIILPRAEQISRHLGVHPAEWSIGRGSHRLGCCGSDSRISLSCMCLFLTPRLRDYIICHELAHLTHFDHSPAFHALCSQYCGGDGDIRRAELKSFVWPIPRE